MDKETYGALKKVVTLANHGLQHSYGKGTARIESLEDIVQVEVWIEEVAKEYEDR